MLTKKEQYEKILKKGIGIENAGNFLLKAAAQYMEFDRRVEETIKLVKARGYTTVQMGYTILFMPRFNAKRITDLDHRDLVSYYLLVGCISIPKKDVIYNFLQFVGDLDWTQLEELKRSFANEYIAQDLAHGVLLYLDGHVLRYFGIKKIPKAFSTTTHGMVPGIILFFIHDETGAPLYFLVKPGDTHLTKVVMPVIAELDQISFQSQTTHELQGVENVTRTIVYDRGGVSGKIMTAIDRHEESLNKFICLTTNNKTVWKGIRRVKRFRPYRRLDHEEKLEDGKERYRIADSRLFIPNFVPEDSPDGKTRCAVIHDRKKDRKYAIATNHTDKKKFPITTIGDIYFFRWPRQENSFRDMKYSVNLDVMIGYGAKKVPNRVAKRKIERLRRSANNCERKNNGIDTKINNLKREIKTLKKEAARIEPIGKGRREFAKIMRKVGMLEEHVKRERNRKSSYAHRKKALESELTGVDPNSPLFDLDTKKMDFMTALRTFLTNCHRFVMKAMGEPYTEMTFNKASDNFYSRGGIVRLRDDGVLSICFSPFPKKHQHAALKACKKLNELKVKSPEGWTYNFKVKRVSV